MSEEKKVRKLLTKSEAKLLSKGINKCQPGAKRSRYNITPKEWEYIKRFRATPNKREFVETIRKFNEEGNLTSTVEKLQSEPIEVPEDFELIKISTSQTTGQQWTQYAKKKLSIDEESIDFEAILTKHLGFEPNPYKIAIKTELVSAFDRLVYTDVHIGMTTNKNGFSLYGGKWDEEEIMKRVSIMCNHVIQKKKSNVLVIDDYGDFMDGYDGETVRKGHKLPQNLDNEGAFDLGIQFKIALLDNLTEYFDHIICNNICNDNHAGSFGYMVNEAVKRISDIKYENVTTNNVRKFIDHYTIGNHTFIISHGKDGHNLKFGFKPILDAKQVEKIKNYIDEHRLLATGKHIEFAKGDSHQKLFDESTTDAFDYYNYPAFSPSSEWVQTNFKKGMSGFEFFNYAENGLKTHNPYKFEWNTGREETSKEYKL